MAFSDWSIDERKQIIDILKEYPASVRLSVRDKIKEMSAADALETVKALLSPSEDVKGANIPLSKEKPLKDVLSPLETMQGDDIGNKSKKPVKALESPLESAKHTRSRQKKSLGSSHSKKTPTKAPTKAPAKPVKPCEAVKGKNTPLESVKAPDKPLERVQGDITSPYYFDINTVRSDIYHYIREYLNLHDMTEADLLKAPQRVFGAVSDYVGEKVFKGERILKSVPYDDKGPYTTNNNQYDIDKVQAILSLYYSICKEYNKAFLLDYAAGFLAVRDQTLYNIAEKLTESGFDIFKKREASLAAGIVDGKSSPVGSLAVLNRFHGWAGTGANRTEVRETTVMYPVLVDINKSTSEGLPDNSNK